MARTPHMQKSPSALVLRTYQVGFGDCFLLSFEYDDDEQRHILIDFGSQKNPPGQTNILEKVAKSIKKISGGKLHVVVATHRHQDHIKGFGLKRAGKIIKDLAPDIVMQPWTEDPDIAVDAGAPANSRSLAARRLSNMNEFAESFFGPESGQPLKHLKRTNKTAFERMTFTGENNIKNRAAVLALQEMADSGKGLYLHAKKKVNLSTLLPGVQIDVLGPPTVQQHAGVRRQRSKDPDEFWHLQAATANAMSGNPKEPFPSHKAANGRRDTFWFRQRLKSINLDLTYSVVRALDRAMNNTSLILLFRAGGKSFLFPGDAQLENWQFALQDEEVMAMLSEVDVYKVGHHGSLNATPKTLWREFKNKSTRPNARKRMTSLLSTLEGKHGHSESGTEVPRTKLVEQLEKHTNLISTEEMDDQLFVPVRFEF